MVSLKNCNFNILTNTSDLSESMKPIVVNDENDIIISSETHESCKQKPCIVGIDEAGRGPVLGPMVYGIFYCVKENEQLLKTVGCADSKSLTEEKRDDIFKSLFSISDDSGWIVDVISPNKISNCMLRRQKFSLNEISHGTAIELINLLLKIGVNVSEVYVDTVGPPEKYEDKLNKIFPGIQIKVSKKADSIYPVVSAASICAKVIRDFAIKNWKFTENVKINEETGWGSGYPNDPATKKFLTENIDQIFGFPRIVRFSWSTSDVILKENSVPVYWSDDEDENGDVLANNPVITSFFKSSQNDKKITKHSFFADRNLETIDDF